ncbi:MarR family winged helix-turn-helix transcriptional regulator [Paracoccus aminophilus]|uniref:Transcriptional regulator, MarR family n=1 Tax=Paracoccus aminophilus JCM 7686 TaxID=1367847 RepID=S5Z0P1_PARAH|nr:MarR family transcriptional regulator [Paracoccus aminophilus]AGT11016.1 transcriptional regulator, MarR family [Paracoccus aminophilus JCM 7686]
MDNSADKLSQCLVLNTVSAARVLLRRYDQRLRVHGVTVQQFALLAAIRSHPSEPVAAFAQKVALDRTSLTRSLDLLEKKGLVRRVSGTGNARLGALTEAGDRLLDTLQGEWLAAQSELTARVTETEAATYLRVAKALSQE